MGLDFIAAKKRALRRMYDGGKAALETPDLLPADQAWEEQHVLFDVHDGVALAEGEELVVQISGTSLVALRGYDLVATAENPPETVVTAIGQRKGYTLARVARFSAASRTADLAFRLR